MATAAQNPASALDSAFRLARRRIVPFLLLMYILSFLDRANIGFAKQAFQASTGVSDAAYALGAGLFFLPTRCSRCQATSSCTGSAHGSGWPASWSLGAWSRRP